MDILNSLLKDKGADLLSGLVGQGFSQEQADKFLPAAGSSIMSALDDNDGAQDTDSILSKIDIASLASKIGIDSSLASKGLQQLIPVLMSKFGSGDLGGLVGKVKNFF